MGSSAQAINTTPQPPPGFVPETKSVAPPPGFVPEQQRAAPTWWDHLKSALSSPPQTAEQFVKQQGGPIQTTGQSPAEKAYEDIKAGNYADAIHRTVTSIGSAMTPLLAPAAAAAPVATAATVGGSMMGQYLLKKGGSAVGLSPSQSDVAGDVGSILGGMGGGAASEGLASVVSGSNAASRFARTVPPSKVDVAPVAGEMQPALASTPRNVLDYAQTKGIELTPGQGTGGRVSKTVEAIGERSLFGGEQLEEAKNLNAMRLARNIKNIADASDPKGMGLSEEQAGETIQQTAKVAQDVAHENASNAYKNLPQELIDEPVPTSSINSKYYQSLKNSQVSLANRDPQMASQVSSAYQRGANLGTPDLNANGSPYMKPELTFGDMMKVRSDAIKDGTALVRAGAPSEVQGIYNGLAKDIDGAMESRANALGYTDEWRDANAGWKDYQSKYNDTQSPLYRILNQRDPASVTRGILNRGSAADIELLQQENMAPALDALRRQTIMDIANRGFRTNADGLGGYSDAFLNTLFGRPRTQELYVNGELARRFNFQMNPSGTSNVLMGESQLNPLEWWNKVIPAGAAKATMPRPAASYLPGASRPSSTSTPASQRAAIGLAGTSLKDLLNK